MKAIAPLSVYTYMDSVMKADIFFFISSIAVIVLTAGALVAEYYIVRSLQRIERFAERVEEKMYAASEEVQEIGSGIKESFIYNLIFKKKKRAKTTKH